MSPQADLDSHEADDDATEQEAARDDDPLAGLHAKLYVMDDGWHARVWTGSANATDAAFDRNVEFLVELRGLKSKCGIDALLGAADSGDGLRPLLLPCDVADEVEPDDPVRAELRARLRSARAALLTADLGISIEPEDDRFTMTIAARTPIDIPGEVVAEVWPVTLRPGSARPLNGDAPAVEFRRLTEVAITAFVAVRLTAQRDATEEEERFVLLLPMAGEPPDRLDRVMRALLTSPEQVLRLLLLLLSGEGLRVGDLTRTGDDGDAWTPFGASGGPTLLESLLTALAADRAALDHVEHLIRDLQRTEEGRALLPAGLERILEPILSVRRSARS